MVGSVLHTPDHFWPQAVNNGNGLSCILLTLFDLVTVTCKPRATQLLLREVENFRAKMSAAHAT